MQFLAENIATEQTPKVPSKQRKKQMDIGELAGSIKSMCIIKQSD